MTLAADQFLDFHCNNRLVLDDENICCQLVCQLLGKTIDVPLNRFNRLAENVRNLREAEALNRAEQKGETVQNGYGLQAPDSFELPPGGNISWVPSDLWPPQFPAEKPERLEPAGASTLNRCGSAIRP